MTMDLRERLGALADAAPTTVSTPDLWRRGRRRQVRRALAATVAIAAVSTIVGIGGATIARKVESIGPVTSPSERMRLPDRFFSPSPWLKGTDDTGPIGPLVAVTYTVRRSWRSSSNGLVGVSATTGEYRFLDLPGWGRPTSTTWISHCRPTAPDWPTGSPAPLPANRGPSWGSTLRAAWRSTTR